MLSTGKESRVTNEDMPSRPASKSKSRNDEFHLLEDIIKDSIRDIGTQTADEDLERKNAVKDKTASGKDTSLPRNIHHRTSTVTKHHYPNISSTFRLFIVPDGPDAGHIKRPGIKLSVEEAQNSQGNSVCLSVMPSDDWHCAPRTNSKKSKRRDNSKKYQNADSFQFDQFNWTESEREDALMTTKARQPVREHWLMDSANPSVCAWLKLKNFEEKQKRIERRREKKEQKRAAREEAKKRQRREQESAKKFAQWLSAKKKKAKRAWRQKHAMRRVDVANDLDSSQQVTSEELPPPNYTVVPTFNGVRESWLEGMESLSLGEGKESLSEKGEPSMKEKLVDGDFGLKNASGHPGIESGSKDSKGTKGATYETWAKQKQSVNKNKRPNTGGGRTAAVSEGRDTEGSNRVTYEAWLKQKHRERKKGGHKSGDERLVFDRGKKASEGSNGITYECWLEQKRFEDKEKAKEKKRQVVDEALTEGILKMAQRRVENSRQGKKEVDTGIPRWRARNRVKSASGDTSPCSATAVHKEYVLRSEIQGNDISADSTNASRSTSAGGKESSGSNCHRGNKSGTSEVVGTIRKFCDNVKLYPKKYETARDLHESEGFRSETVIVPYRD